MRRTVVLPPEFEDCIGIFQGGGCRAAAYAGAYSAALAHGVNFDEVAGASAGAIAAVLIAAGAEPDWLEQTLKELDFASLLSRPKGRRMSLNGENRASQIWNLVRFNGIHDGKLIESWVEDRLRTLLPDATNKKIMFSDLAKPAAVIAANLELQEPVVWSTSRTPQFSVSEAVRSSCTIPFFFQPHGPFVDGGVVSNLPLHIVENDESDRRRVLAFTLLDTEQVDRPQDVMATAMALAGTVTHGGQAIQSELNRDIDVITIRCGDVRATDFNRMTPDVISRLVEAGRSAVDEFFDSGVVSATPVRPSQVSTHLAQTLATVADHILGAQSHVLIAARDTQWVFELYTSLLLARLRSVPVTVILPEDRSTSPAVIQQRDTLTALGCLVAYLPPGEMPPIQAFICDPGEYGAVAVLPSKPDLEIHARLLTSADGDEDAINLVARELRPRAGEGSNNYNIVLAPASPEEVVRSLQTVKQYSFGQTIDVKGVELDKIDAWARYAHVYKQTQQRAMIRTLRGYGFDEFAPYFVRYGDRFQSLALPIVLEERPDGRCTVVNGLSRLLILKREGRDRAMCAVVSNVTDPAPAKGVAKLSDLGVRVGLRGNAKHRYPGFVYQNVRKVESDAHTLRPLSRSGASDGATD